jgi:hypothetical protein
VDDRAPKADVNTAIDGWCNDHDGWKIADLRGQGQYMRFPIEKLGVSNRASLWIRAAVYDEKSCPGARVQGHQCLQALRDGMDQCDPNSEYTYGHTTEAGKCVQYSMVPSGITLLGTQIRTFHPRNLRKEQPPLHWRLV